MIRMALFRGRHKSDATSPVAGIETLHIPTHIAVIMDGNGRWAQARGMPRIEGHRRGATTVRRISEACREIGVSYLTLYCFSNENWKRPQEELSFLMSLLKTYLIQERPTLLKNDIRLTIIGRRAGIPGEVLFEMDRSVELSKNGKSLTLCLAINYGSRQEIVDAIRTIASEVQSGTLNTDAINESVVAERLYTSGMPDPDLLIRTSGEMRISNYLLWQISYSEIWITDKPWPEFDTDDLIQAIADYNKRDRRFGGLGEVRNH